MAIKCTNLIYTPINGLTVRISGGTASLIPHTLKNKIVSLESEGNIIITKYETTNSKNSNT